MNHPHHDDSESSRNSDDVLYRIAFKAYEEKIQKQVFVLQCQTNLNQSQMIAMSGWRIWHKTYSLPWFQSNCCVVQIKVLGEVGICSLRWGVSREMLAAGVFSLNVLELQLVHYLLVCFLHFCFVCCICLFVYCVSCVMYFHRMWTILQTSERNYTPFVSAPNFTF